MNSENGSRRSASTIDRSALAELNKIRNDMEHFYTNATSKKVREAIARAFPVVADLFKLLREEPHKHLGESWEVMLEVKSVYDKELAECEASFGKAGDWKSDSMAHATRVCPQCDSRLIHRATTPIQKFTTTPTQSAAPPVRRRYRRQNMRLMETALRKFLRRRQLRSGERRCGRPARPLPECSYETYVMTGEENGCDWCQLELGKCLRCDEQLTPNNVAF